MEQLEAQREQFITVKRGEKNLIFPPNYSRNYPPAVVIYI